MEHREGALHLTTGSITNLYDFKDSQTKLQHLRHFTYIQKEIQLNRYDPESLHLNKFITV